MSLVVIIWCSLCSIFLTSNLLYFFYMKRASFRPWRLKINKNYTPSISVIVPTFNEEDTIGLKLENLSKLEYLRELTQIILIDSESTDNTLGEAYKFLHCHPETNVKILMEETRGGKSKALNLALKSTKSEVIVVSDSDCFLPPDTFSKALPYLSDPSVGAVSGRKVLLNPNQSWVTKTETHHLDLMTITKLGESKIHSTVFFEGGFSAYKREFLDQFDPYESGSDDCGTVISLAQKGVRTIFVPEAAFYTSFPNTWKGRIRIKTRRAYQLVQIFARYLTLLLRKKLSIPKMIVLSNIYLYILNPMLFIALNIATFFLLLELPLAVFVFIFPLIPKTRLYLLEILQNYYLLSSALIAFLANKKFVVWGKIGDRPLVTEDMLHDRNLI